ncbi:hypothetical protein DRP53_07720, partial [candidate division WOR-3 bacterium]
PKGRGHSGGDRGRFSRPSLTSADGEFYPFEDIRQLFGVNFNRHRCRVGLEIAMAPIFLDLPSCHPGWEAGNKLNLIDASGELFTLSGL